MRFSFGTMPVTQLSVKLLAASAISRID